MKKIGIITTSCGGSGTFACNYGAALQGYALVKQLRILGFDAHDINYVSANEYRPQQYNVIKRTLLRLRLIFNVKLVKQKIDEHKNRENRKMLRDAFVDFIKKSDLTYNDGAFYRIEELEKMSGEFYAFITGSDVVWNPLLRKGINDKGYFLDFAAEGVKRIAYAPSIGLSVLPDTAKTDLKELLNKFTAISIREESGADIIRQETGLEAKVVLDPTMLLEPAEYDEIAKVPQGLPEKYIAVYRFGKLEHTKEKIIEISEKLNLPIVYIPSNNDGAFEPMYNIGPSEFIGIIRNAELVLSDSFHCTVFALINNKPFLTFCRTLPCPEKDINSRMTDLLKRVNMYDRMVMPGNEIVYDNLFNIDFTEADSVIRAMRAESLAYLKNALEEQ